MDYPETPEGVALFLLLLALAQKRITTAAVPRPASPDILELYAELAASRLSPSQILDQYAECLRTVSGKRDVTHARH